MASNNSTVSHLMISRLSTPSSSTANRLKMASSSTLNRLTPNNSMAPQLACVSVGPRFLALLIDSVIIGVVGGLLSLPFHNATGVLGGSIGILTLLYFIVMEATRGATLGKMALGLRVVKTDGSPISWSESIIRNLLRIIDGLFVYLVGAILVWTSPLRQRLGDRAAKTVVIRSRG